MEGRLLRIKHANLVSLVFQEPDIPAIVMHKRNRRAARGGNNGLVKPLLFGRKHSQPVCRQFHEPYLPLLIDGEPPQIRKLSKQFVFVKYARLWVKFSNLIGIGFDKPDMAILIGSRTLGAPVSGGNGIPF